MNIMMKYTIPRMMNMPEMPTLIWRPSIIGVAIAFARPNPMMEMPVARPL